MRDREPWEKGFIIEDEEPKAASSTPEQQEEIFDIREDLDNILKLPTADRPEALKQYKEKLGKFHRGMAVFQKELIQKVRENPDISLEELTEALDKAGEELGFNEFSGGNNTHEASKSVLEEYTRRHLAVHEARLAHPDDKELYKYLFAKEPEGKIKIIEGPMILYVCCENIEDYSHATGYSYLNEGANQEEKMDLSGGSFLSHSIHENLHGCICVENSSTNGLKNAPNKHSYTHEEQHAFYTMVWRNIYDNYSKEEDFLKAKTTEQKKLAISRKLRDIRELAADDRAKDEILAFMKGHSEHPHSTTKEIVNTYKRYWDGYSKISKIIELIKYFIRIPKDNRYGGYVNEHLAASKEAGGPYDYLADHMETSVEQLKSLLKPEDYPLINEMIEKVFVTEYKQIIMRGLETFIILKQGGYSVDETIAILQAYSLREWGKVPERVLPYKPKVS